MALYVKLNENKEVVSVLDYALDEDYVEAIEVKPEIDFRKQYYVGHTTDVSEIPVKFVYEIGEFSVEQRKNAILERLTYEYTTKSNSYVTNSTTTGELNVRALSKLLDQFNSNKTLLADCTSHAELDSLSLD